MNSKRLLTGRWARAIAGDTPAWAVVLRKSLRWTFNCFPLFLLSMMRLAGERRTPGYESQFGEFDYTEPVLSAATVGPLLLGVCIVTAGTTYLAYSWRRAPATVIASGWELKVPSVSIPTAASIGAMPAATVALLTAAAGYWVSTQPRGTLGQLLTGLFLIGWTLTWIGFNIALLATSGLRRVAGRELVYAVCVDEGNGSTICPILGTVVRTFANGPTMMVRLAPIHPDDQFEMASWLKGCLPRATYRPGMSCEFQLADVLPMPVGRVWRSVEGWKARSSVKASQDLPAVTPDIGQLWVVEHEQENELVLICAQSNRRASYLRCSSDALQAQQQDWPLVSPNIGGTGPWFACTNLGTDRQHFGYFSYWVGSVDTGLVSEAAAVAYRFDELARERERRERAEWARQQEDRDRERRRRESERQRRQRDDEEAFRRRDEAREGRRNGSSFSGPTTEEAQRAQHLAVLGLTQGASLKEAKKAYRRFVTTHHPDKGGNPSVFRQGQEAWEFLQRDYHNPSGWASSRSAAP